MDFTLQLLVTSCQLLFRVGGGEKAARQQWWDVEKRRWVECEERWASAHTSLAFACFGIFGHSALDGTIFGFILAFLGIAYRDISRSKIPLGLTLKCTEGFHACLSHSSVKWLALEVLHRIGHLEMHNCTFLKSETFANFFARLDWTGKKLSPRHSSCCRLISIFLPD